MTNVGISQLGIEELLGQYINLSIEQGRAVDLCLGSSKINRVGAQIYEINNDLKQRPGDQRRALIGLFSHPNFHVRFNAATSSIGTMPTESRETIQTIADSNWAPLAFHAKMYLGVYDREASKLLKRDHSKI